MSESNQKHATEAATFVVRLCGPHASDGVDAGQLGSMLAALSTTIGEANRIANPAGRDLALVAKPFQRGSFEVVLKVVTQEVVKRIMDYAIGEGKQALDLLLYLGFVVGNDVNLMNMIRMLKGAHLQPKALSDDKFEYPAESGSVIVPGVVHNLYQDCTIQTNIYNIFGAPLEGKDISSISTCLKGRESEALVVSTSELPALRHYANRAAVPTADETSSSSETVVYLKPVRGSYTGDPRAKAYQFQRGEGVRITAAMRDEAFLGKMTSGQVRLHHTDTLRVLLSEHQEIKGSKLSSRYEILKVLEYKQLPEQISFN